MTTQEWINEHADWYAKVEQKVNPIMQMVANIINEKRDTDKYGKIRIAFFIETEETIAKYGEWKAMGLMMYPGRECIYVWCNEEPLYAVNVSGDSILTIIDEAMQLIARKF